MYVGKKVKVEGLIHVIVFDIWSPVFGKQASNSKFFVNNERLNACIT